MWLNTSKLRTILLATKGGTCWPLNFPFSLSVHCQLNSGSQPSYISLNRDVQGEGRSAAERDRMSKKKPQLGLRDEAVGGWASFLTHRWRMWLPHRFLVEWNSRADRSEKGDKVPSLQWMINNKLLHYIKYNIHLILYHITFGGHFYSLYNTVSGSDTQWRNTF